jgi:hypothetical protein
VLWTSGEKSTLIWQWFSRRIKGRWRSRWRGFYSRG